MPVSSSLSEVKSRPDSELLVLKINLARQTLLDAIIAYQDSETDRYYIALADFVYALEFPIETDPINQTAKGWFLNESTSFDLDIKAETLSIKGQTYNLNYLDLEMHDDGIYVSLEALQKWFPITLDVNFNELAIIVESLEPLPIELRMMRDANRSNMRSNLNDQIYPKADIDHPTFSIPVVDTSTQLLYTDNETTGQDTRLSFSADSKSIIANQDVDFSFSETTNDNLQPTMRLTVGRKDNDKTLFEPIGFTEYSMGDVITLGQPLISKSNTGRGVYVSSFPITYNRQSRDNTTILRGTLLSGYQVDLLRNGQIIDFIEAPNDDGEYVFEDVVLYDGLNIFKLVFYGPQGQKETKEERIYVSNSRTKEGEFNFSGSIIEDNTNLLTNRTNTDVDTGELRSTMEVEYGISAETSLYGSYSAYSLDGENRSYVMTGYGTSLAGISTNLRLATSNDSGRAYGIQLQSEIANIQWQLNHNIYTDFISEETTENLLPGIIETDTEFRFNGSLPIGFNNILPFSVKITHQTDALDNRLTDSSLRLTQNISKVRLTAEVNNIVQTNREDETSVTFFVSSRFDDFTIRGDTTYEMRPDSRLESASITTDFHVSEDTNLRAGYRYNKSTVTTNTLSLGVSQKYDTAHVNFNLSHSDQGNTTGIIGLSKSFAYDALNDHLLESDKKLTRNAILSARVFLDENNNSIFDEGDHYLENVGFEGNGIKKEQTTDENGLIYLAGLRPQSGSPLQINPTTLGDPFLRSVHEKESYDLRAGAVYHKEFPVVRIGEIDGSVITTLNGAKEGAQSIYVTLSKPHADNYSLRTRTEFDGFVLFQDVPMGDYLINLDQEQITKLGYCPTQARYIAISADEPFLSLAPIILYPATLPEDRAQALILKEHSSIDALEARWFDLQNKYSNALQGIAHHISPTESGSYQLYIGPLKQEKIKTLCHEIGTDIKECFGSTWNYCPEEMQETYDFIDN